jgi:polysaccharide export outer membrane protein
MTAFLCSAIWLSGCISSPPVSNLPPAPKGAIHIPVPVVDRDPYRLQVGDVIDIKPMLNPELEDQVVVQPDGMISTAVAEDVSAYGRTTRQVRKELEEKYQKLLSHPHIAVLVRSFAPNRIYVTGEVGSPGEFINVGPNLSLVQAIARAGGLKNSARPDKIIIIRRGAEESPEVYAADYTAAVSGADPESDVRLAPYDVVYVPRSGIGDVYLYFQQYVQQFVPVSFGLGYQVNNQTTFFGR